MQTFLEKTAAYIYEKYKQNLSDICIVLPNRRASLFLKKYLAKKIDKNIWAPAMYSIEDFICEISGMQIIDPISLLFDLYDTHKTIEKENAQPIDEFINWAQILLNDFNEIDLYLVEPEKIFSYLNDAKAIAVWNLNNKPLTEFEKKYLKFFNSLNKYYSILNNRLSKKNFAYKGLAYRKLAEQIESKSLEWNKIIFVGFNALSSAEEKIIKYLIDNDKAEILWDADEYYLNDKQNKKDNKIIIQEAGKFIRKYIDKFNKHNVKWIEDNFSNDKKDITIIGVPKNIGQARIVGQILSETNMDNNKQQNTAVVLSDENLLIPVLNAVPENIKTFNVTMGLPLKLTPVFELFDELFTLHENQQRFSNIQSEKDLEFYYKDVLKILHHPYIFKLKDIISDNESSILNKIIQEVQSSNKIFFTLNDLKSIFSKTDQSFFKIIKHLFNNWQDNSLKALDDCLMLINDLRDAIIKQKYNSENQDVSKNDKIELEYLFSFAKIIKRIKVLLSDHKVKVKLKTLRSIFNQFVNNSSISFYGEPLEGIQFMGMLETRTLDFETVIMLSVNEGIIPQQRNQNSFIPYDIRRKFNLPIYKDKEAIYAYHFYRLLQKSKNIYLLYNTESDQLGGGDKSRFVTQIINELPKYNSNIKIHEELLSVPPVKSSIDYSIKIYKTEDVLNKLMKIAASGFSASSLNTYINCPLQFYFKEIAGLSEEEEVEENIEAATLGTVIHEVLYVLYQPFLNVKLTKDIVKQMIQKVESLTKKSFKKHYENGDVNYGKNLLIVRVANIFVRNFLKQEIKFIDKIEKQGESLIIKYLEQTFKSPLRIEDNDDTKPTLYVNLKGKIDRIDFVGDNLRIIDYKTGFTKKNELNVKDWGDLLEESKFAKSFQLLMYVYLFHQNHPDLRNIESGIISFRKLSNGLMKVVVPETKFINEKTYDKIEEKIRELIIKIFNNKIPFNQTDKIENCKYCPFKVICNR